MKPLRTLNRWIDRAWLDEGLLRARPNLAPLRLYVVPSAVVMLTAVIADQLQSGIVRGVFILELCLFGVFHFYVITRLSYICSITEVSQHLAKGEEPLRHLVERLTE